MAARSSGGGWRMAYNNGMMAAAATAWARRRSAMGRHRASVLIRRHQCVSAYVWHRKAATQAALVRRCGVTRRLVAICMAIFKRGACLARADKSYVCNNNINNSVIIMKITAAGGVAAAARHQAQQASTRRASGKGIKAHLLRLRHQQNVTTANRAATALGARTAAAARRAKKRRQ